MTFLNFSDFFVTLNSLSHVATEISAQSGIQLIIRDFPQCLESVSFPVFAKGLCVHN